MKRGYVLAALVATSASLSACVAYEDGYHDTSRAGYRYYDAPRPVHRAPDRDRDGIPDRADRDRDGDRVPNRVDRRPDDPRRY